MSIEAARRRLRRLGALAAVACLASTALLVVPAAANGVPIAPGDVLISTGLGKIRHFDRTGNLKDTLDTDPTNNTRDDNTGVCLTPTLQMFTTNYSPGTSSAFDAGGNLVNPSFGSGFSKPESCVVDVHGNVLYGNSSSAAPSIVKIDSNGQLVATYPAARDDNGIDWIDLEGDQCTVQYTSESNLVKQYNVCTSTQLPDFAAGFADPGLRCFELRIRPNGEVMVPCTDQKNASAIYRLDATGKVIQTYPGASLPGLRSSYALSLDPDNTSFWVADEFSGQVYHLDIASGAVLGQFDGQELDGFVEGVTVAGPIVAAKPPAKASVSCDLLSTSEIATAFAQPVSAGVPAADTGVCSFGAGAPGKSVTTLLQASGGKPAFVTARKADGGTTLKGLGTKAFFGHTAAGESVVGVLKGPAYLVVSSAGMTTPDPKSALTTLAKLAVARA